jgi:hypothetical protein
MGFESKANRRTFLKSALLAATPPLAAPAAPWTAQKAWSGVNLKNDHAIVE